MKQNKKGYSTTTYRLRLYKKHLDWILQTKYVFNEVVRHYYEVLLERTELLNLSNHLLMRELEILTIGTKEMKKAGEVPEYSLENFPSIPLYFRRAGINCAISMIRSYISLQERWIKQQKEGKKAGNPPKRAESFQAAPIYYKGMYRDFQKDHICLKLFTGKEWKWVNYRFKGRDFPVNAIVQSPSLKVERGQAFLHVPITTEVFDIRTVKERMEGETKICALYVPNQDVIAVCVILNMRGDVLESKYFRGGAQLKEKRKALLKRIEKSQKSRSFFKEEQEKEENQVLWKKIGQLNSAYAHRTSREIITFCLEKEIKIMVVPNYESTISFQKKRYLDTNEFEWQGRKIIRLLKYKAFQNGIIVSTIMPFHITDLCSECGERIQRYNEGHKASKTYYGGKLFICPNGHRGNAGFNAAKNIGRYFLKNFSIKFLSEK